MFLPNPHEKVLSWNVPFLNSFKINWHSFLSFVCFLKKKIVVLHAKAKYCNHTTSQLCDFERLYRIHVMKYTRYQSIIKIQVVFTFVDQINRKLLMNYNTYSDANKWVSRQFISKKLISKKLISRKTHLQKSHLQKTHLQKTHLQKGENC